MSDSPNPPETGSLMDEDYGELETRPYNVGMTAKALMDHAPSSQKGVPESRSAPQSEPPVPLPLDVPSDEPTNPFASVPSGLASPEGARPGPPPAPRRGAAAPGAMRSEMPTLVGEPRPADLAIAGSPPSSSTGGNPFLAGAEGSGAQGGRPVPPRPGAGSQPGASSPQSSAGVPQPSSQARPASAVAPIVGRPGAVSPELADPHAAFKRGSVLRPLTIGLAAVAVVVAVVYLVPTETESEQEVAKAADESAVIGRSLPPYRTTLEEESAEDHRAAFRKSEERTRSAEEGQEAARPSGVPSEGEFKDAFKKAAK